MATEDQSSPIDALARNTKVLLSATSTYHLYPTAVVEASAIDGTYYLHV
jgi:hypothetical protein